MGAFDYTPLRGAELEEEAINPFAQTEIQKGLMRGLSGMGNGLQAAIGQVAQPLSPVMGTSVINDAIATEHQNAETYAPRVASYKDIRNLTDLGDFVAGHGSAMLPMLPLAYGAGGAARALGAGMSGAGVAGAGAFAPQMMGAEAMRLQQDPTAAGLSPEQKLLYTAGVGGAGALAAGMVPGMMGGSLVAPEARGLTSALLTRPAANVVGGAAGMGAGDVMSQHAQKFYNPEHQFNPDQFREAVAAGAAGMVPMAGAHAVPEALGSTGMRGFNAAKDAVTDPNGSMNKLGQGMNVVGRHIYERSPDQVKAAFDKMAEYGRATKETMDDLAPHWDSFTDDVKNTVKTYWDKTKADVKTNLNEADVAGTRPNFSDMAGDVASNAADAATTIGQQAHASVMELAPEIYAKLPKEGQKWFDRMSNSKEQDPDKIIADIADFVGEAPNEQFGKWVKDTLTDGDFQEAQAGKGEFLKRVAPALRGYMESRGLDQHADSKGLVETLDKAMAGKKLNEGDFANVYSLSKLAESHGGIKSWENELGPIFNRVRKGVNSRGEVTSDILKRGGKKEGDAFNAAVRNPEMAESFRNAGIEQSFVDRIANRINADTVAKKGVTRALNEALEAEGLGQYAKTGTPMYDQLHKALFAEKQARMQDVPDSGTEMPPELRRMIDLRLTGNKALARDKAKREQIGEVLTATVEAALGGHGHQNQRDAKRALARMADKARENKDPMTEVFDDIFRAVEDHYGADTTAIKHLSPMAYGNTGRAGVLQRLRERMKLEGTKGFEEEPRVQKMFEQLRDAKNKDSSRDPSIFDRRGDTTPNDTPAIDALHAQWIKDGLITPLEQGKKESAQIFKRRQKRDQEEMLRLVDRYGRVGGNTAPNGWNGRSTLAESVRADENRLKSDGRDEDVGDYEYLQSASERQGGEDGQNFGSREVTDTNGKEKAISTFEENTGTQGEVETIKGPEASFHGRDVFDSQDNSRGRLGAPIDVHAERKFDTGTEAQTLAAARYSPKNAKQPVKISVMQWAEKMAAKTGESIIKYLDDALEATMRQDEKDLKRLERMSGSEVDVAKDIEVINSRRKIADESADGYDFFDHQYNRNLKFLMVEPKDQGQGHYSADQLFRQHSPRDGDEAGFITRLRNADQTKFSRKAYERGMVTLFLDGDAPTRIDLPGLVNREISRTQPGDITGTGDKRSLMNKAEEMDARAREEQVDGAGHNQPRMVLAQRAYEAFKNVMTGILNAEGVNAAKTLEELVLQGTGDSRTVTKNKAGKIIAKTGDASLEFPPDLVIYRNKETGQVITYGQMRGLLGVDAATWSFMREGLVNGKVRVKGQTEEGLVATESRGKNMTPDEEASAINTAAPKGVAAGAATKDGKKVDVDLRQMLRSITERMDYEASVKDLPRGLAAQLLHEAVMELEAKGYNGLRESIMEGKYDSVKLFDKDFGETVSPFFLKELRQRFTTRDNNLVKGEKTTGHVEYPYDVKTAKIMEIDGSIRRLNDVLARNADPESNSFATLSTRLKGEIGEKLERAEGRKINEDLGNFDPMAEKAKTNAMHPEDTENMRLENIMRELRDEMGDTPLFDVAERNLISRYMEAADRIARERKFVEGEKRESFPERFTGESYGDYVAKAKERSEGATEAALVQRESRANVETSHEAAIEMNKEFDASRKAVEKMLEQKLTEQKTLADAESRRLSAENEPGQFPKNTAPSARLAQQKAAAKVETTVNETTTAPVKKGELSMTDAWNKGVQREKEKQLPVREGVDPRSFRRQADSKLAKLREVEATAEAQRVKAKASTGKVEVVEEEITPTKLYTDYGTTEAKANEHMQVWKKATKEQKADMLMHYQENPPQADSIGANIVSFAKKGGRVPGNLETAAGISLSGGKFIRNQEGPFSRATAGLDPSVARTVEELNTRTETLQTELRKLVGDNVELDAANIVTDSAGKAASGKIEKNDKGVWRALISSAHATLEGARETMHHEGWHIAEEVMAGMGKHGKSVLDTVYKYVDSQMVKDYLKSEFNGDEGALGQMDSAREKSAYLFQRFMSGDKFPIPPKVRSIWQKFADWFKELAGITSDHDKVKNLFKMLKEGDFAANRENPSEIERMIAPGKGDKAIHALRVAYEPVAEGVTRVFGHTSERMLGLKIGEAKQIHDLYAGPSGKGGFMAARKLAYYKHANKFGELMASVPEDKIDQLRNRPEFQKIIDSVDTYLQEAGVSDKKIAGLFDKVDSYTHDLILDHKEAFIQDVIKYGGVTGKKADEARRIANEILDKGFYYHPEHILFEGNPKIGNKWRATDIREKMARFLNTASDIGERTRFFGEDSATLNKLIEAVEKKGTPEEKEMVKDYIDSQEGRYGGRMSPEMRTLTGAALTMNNILLLPKAVFAQWMEPAQIANRKGDVGTGFNALFRAITELPRSFDYVDSKSKNDKWTQIAMSLGTAANRIVRNEMSTMYNGTPITGRVGWLNDKFFQYNGMEQTNRSMHVEATKAAIEFLKEHSANAKAGKGAKDNDGQMRSARFLTELGLKPEDVVFDKNDMPMNGKLERGINQWVEEAMAHPDAGSNALWMNDERFALISHMKRFAFSFSKYVLDHGEKEWGKGNYFAMAALPMAMGFMAASEAIKDAITPGVSRTAGMDFMEYTTHLANRAGLGGRGQIITDAIGAANMGGSPLEALMGPTAESASKGMRGLAHMNQVTAP